MLFEYYQTNRINYEKNTILRHQRGAKNRFKKNSDECKVKLTYLKHLNMLLKAMWVKWLLIYSISPYKHTHSSTMSVIFQREEDLSPSLALARWKWLEYAVPLKYKMKWLHFDVIKIYTRTTLTRERAAQSFKCVQTDRCRRSIFNVQNYDSSHFMWIHTLRVSIATRLIILRCIKF